MRHLNGYRKLGRTSAHRKAMLRNMATSLVLHERIDTTLQKAKEVRSLVEKMITLGKRGDLHARRQADSFFFDAVAVKKVFEGLAPRFKERTGGYTRILKRGFRVGDSADLATIEFVDFVPTLEAKVENKAK
jgi:large subunit ribosomal protein L17